MNAPGVQLGVAPHTSKRKFDSISLPRGVCATSGWNWTAKIGRSRCRNPAIGLFGVRAVAM